MLKGRMPGKVIAIAMAVKYTIAIHTALRFIRRRSLESSGFE